jgi:hypothetical protein
MRLVRRPSFVVALLSAAICLVVSGGDAGPANAAVVVPVPASIDDTGAQDVTDPLNAFLATLAPGTTAQFERGARYRIEGVLLVFKKSDITIDGNGATFFASTNGKDAKPPRAGFRHHWPRRRQQWDVRNSSAITLRDFTIDGANPSAGPTPAAYVPALEGQAGIGISRTNGIVIDSVRITDTYGDFIWITGQTKNVTIHNSTFARSGRQGIAVVSGSNIVIEDNDIRDVALSVFDLEPLGKNLAQNVRIRDNVVGEYRNLLLAAGGGGPGVNDIWLESNRVTADNGIQVFAGHLRQQRRGYHILNNVGTGVATPTSGTGRPGLFQFLNLDGVEIRGNVQQLAGGPILSLERVCNLTYGDNEISGYDEERVELAPCGAPTP